MATYLYIYRLHQELSFVVLEESVTQYGRSGMLGISAAIATCEERKFRPGSHVFYNY
jgi:hypothetical protein